MYKRLNRIFVILFVLMLAVLSACAVMTPEYVYNGIKTGPFDPYSDKYDFDMLDVGDAKFFETKADLANYLAKCIENRYKAAFVRTLYAEDLVELDGLDRHFLRTVKRTIMTGSNGNCFAVYQFEHYAGDNVLYAYRTGDKSLLSVYENDILTVSQRFLKANIDDTMSDIEKELVIHDYIVDTLTYKQKGDNERDDYFITSAYSIITGYANCQGYTDAFYMLANMAGMKTEKIAGEAGGIEHTWNSINIDGSWVYVDVTFDDTSFDGDEIPFYAYFNVPKEYIEISHTFYDYNPEYAPSGYENFYYNYIGTAIFDDDDFHDKVYLPFAYGQDHMTVFIVSEDVQKYIDLLKTHNLSYHFSYYMVNGCTLLDIKVGQ